MKIIIVDDDKIVSSSLKTIIESTNEIKVLDIGNNGIEAIELYEKHVPDILLMDIRMPLLTGIEAGEHILNKHPNAKIIFLTTFSDDDYIIKALKIGAKGYILKQDFENITSSLKSVFNGQSVFGSEIIGKLPNLLNKSNPNHNLDIYNLNTKEVEIIKCISEGLSNKEISNTLYLSEGTIRNYISLILEKLELRDRTQIAIFYYKNT